MNSENNPMTTNMRNANKLQLEIPYAFKQILETDHKLNSLVLGTTADFEDILAENNLYFFEEYTNHGFKHIQQLLFAAEHIIQPNTTATLLSPYDVAILILAIIFHDLGMHTSFSMFKRMIDGEYDTVRLKELDDKRWGELWEEYLSEARKFSGKQRQKVFGNAQVEIKIPSLENKDDLNGVDKKLIGEFIRRHHPRIAHEIALAGFLGPKDQKIPFTADLVYQPRDFKNIVGLLARSHGIEIRDTYDCLKSISEVGLSIFQ